MDGKALAEKVRAQVARDVEGLGAVGIATVLVGDDPGTFYCHPHELVGASAGWARLPWGLRAHPTGTE